MFNEEEVNIMTRLVEQFQQGLVVKRTILKARDIWNKHNAPKIEYCMCSSIQRKIYAKQFIEWYEAVN